ncbi:MAG: prepilin-type N-terminal cleavage/methylation domain-containing protein [Gammaproteobacteria bacterium]|nr:prepilin-type N-terminal cleavage/methylation domain-containing protein [Gammaproteobacteria bacterium]
MLTRASQHGFSLVELMVAITLGLFVLAGISSLYAEVVRSNAAVLRTAHLQQTLWSLMTLITDDVRRAGYWSRAELTLDGTGANGFAPIHVVDGNCILYSYDEEKDDTDGAPDPEDHHGFRLTGAGLQLKTSDNTCGGTTCADCGSGTWWLMNDAQGIRVTALSFTLTEHARPFDGAGREIVARGIDISLEGELASDPSVHQRLDSHISVRNHEIR